MHLPVVSVLPKQGEGLPPSPQPRRPRHPLKAKTLYKKFAAKKSPEERGAVPAAGRHSATRSDAGRAGTRAAVGGIPTGARCLQWTSVAPRDLGCEHSSFPRQG